MMNCNLDVLTRINHVSAESASVSCTLISSKMDGRMEAGRRGEAGRGSFMSSEAERWIEE